MTKTKKTTRRTSRADGITVREIGRKTYEVDFTVTTAEGRYRFRKKAPKDTIAGARAWGKKFRDEILATGTKVQAEPARADPTKPRDFATWAARFIEDAQSPAKRGGPNRASTLRSKTLIVNKHLVPAFGRRPVTAVDDDAVERYVKAKAKEGLATGTIRLHGAQLLGVLRLAKRKGCPAERAMALPTIRIDKPKDKLPATLSEEQTSAMLEGFADAPSWQRTILVLLFREGLRCGEALGLRWADIDFTTETIRIQRSLSEGEIGRTKGGKVRPIPLHWQVREALLEHGVGDGWVFPSPIGKDGPRSYESVKDTIGARWKSTCDFRGDDGKPIRFRSHLGRHSLGRHWAQRGWPLRGLQELLGHSDIKVTQVYMHWAPSQTAPFLQQLGRADTDLVSRLRAAGATEELLKLAGLEGQGALPAKRPKVEGSRRRKKRPPETAS